MTRQERVALKRDIRRRKACTQHHPTRENRNTMKIEVGDYIEHTWDEHYGVVTKVVEKPYGMGVTLFAASSTGEVEEVTEGNFVADFGIGRSDHHIWAEGEQAEYDALRAKGRTLYDQIRTRLSLSHAQAIAITQEAVQA